MSAPMTCTKKPARGAPVGASAPPPAAPQPAGLAAPPVYHDGLLPLRALRPSPTNLRKTFDEERLQNLAQSIRVDGLAQPIVVRPVGAPGGPAPRLGPKGWDNVE
ncbi:MAG TPA: ParB N-terminal domain-containing protein [Urbifossiella sp.]|nr:ParB N-terminal domain-containing protein [Urbifossiella sp.]